MSDVTQERTLPRFFVLPRFDRTSRRHGERLTSASRQQDAGPIMHFLRGRRYYGQNPRSVSLAVLAVFAALATALLVSTESVSASDPPEPESTTESPYLPDESPPPNVTTDVQHLRERVPPSLFPEITETLQLKGAIEVYGAVQDLSGEQEYSFENPVHSLGAKLGPGGVSISSDDEIEWAWSIDFEEYGRGTSFNTVPDPSITAAGSRVEYQYPGGITEWYVNGPLGLQQGFTFESKPSSSVEGPLVVRLNISGDVTVEVSKYGTSAVLSYQESLSSLRYGGLYAYDANGAELGARLQATTKGLSILVDDAGAKYPVTIDPFIEKNYLVGYADDPRREFGISVSVSGDTVVVGAPQASRWGIPGAVYLFSTSGGELTSEPEGIVLSSPRSVEGDGFGYSVSISGDTIVVGAPWERDLELDDWQRFGAGYVFTKPSGGWASTSDAARLTSPNALSEYSFGTSVAINGDTVVVGTGDRYTSGSTYVFSKPSGGWTDLSEAAELSASDGSDNDMFGQSVAVNGDTVIVGAFLADLKADEEDFGAAYVYTKPSNGWADATETVKLVAPDGAEGREFGRSLSLDGDTLVVGAPFSGYYSPYETYREAREAEDKTPYLGSVYVYSVANADWADPPSPVKITSPDGFPWTRFGWSVSVDGDAIVVGEPQSRSVSEPDGYPDITGGSAYVFTKPTEGWSSASEYRELPMPDSMFYDHYGASVFVSGDMVVVGASEDDNENGPNAGSAFLFEMPEGWTSDTPLAEPATLKAFDTPAGDRFGHSVDMDEDILVVGVPGDHDQVPGAAYVFFRQSNEWKYISRRLEPSDATPGGRFGSSVAVGGDTIAVGAPGTEDGEETGAVYVYTTPADGWTGVYDLEYSVKLAMPDGDVDDRFGHSVATDGNFVVVGVPGENVVYVYTRPDAGWAETTAPAKLTMPNASTSARFGHAVSISEGTIVAGAPGGSGTGVSYVFTKPDTGWSDTSAAARLTATDGASGDRFGYAVSASGSTVIVGAPGNENGEDTGAAYVYTKPGAGWSNTSTAAKLTASDGAAGDWFGHAVSVSDEFIVVGAHGSEITTGEQVSDDAGAVYAFRRPQDGWTSSSDAQKLTAKQVEPGDSFGYVVSVDGDAIAVGSPTSVGQRYYDLRGVRSGAVRIFTWPGLYWVDTPDAFKIRPPNAETSRIFGVTLSADGNTAVVGTVQAVATDAPSATTAKAFVYSRDGGEWDTSSPATLTLPTGSTFSQHGLSVSENGDTVAVGITPVPTETTSEPSYVLVFTRSDGGWVSTSTAARLAMPDGETEGKFGHSVAVSGGTIVVGAYGTESYEGPQYKGSAFVYTKPDGGWTSTSSAAKLSAIAGDPRDEFGRTVAVSGDTIVVGAPGDRNLWGRRSGSAYVFTRPEAGWVSTFESAKLVSPDAWFGRYGSQFGPSIAIRGSRIVIGAPGGSATYVFTRPEGGWDDPYVYSRLTAPVSDDSYHFGASVSMSDDAIYVGADSSGTVFAFPIPPEGSVFTGVPARLADPHGGERDRFGGVVSAGGTSIVVGALESDDNGENFGAAYVFNVPSDGWEYSTGPMGRTATLISPDWNIGQSFGSSISPTTEAIAVGAWNSPVYSNSGAAYVFTGPFSSLFAISDAAKLSPPDGVAEWSFGWSVSLTTNAMAVGSPGHWRGLGAVYVYAKPDDGWVSSSDAAKLSSPRGDTDRYFGISVSLSGGTAAVGATRDSEAGSAYLFTKPQAGPWQSTSDAIEVNAPRGEGLPLFGSSVALTEDTLVVGMPSGTDPGAVYVYTKPASGWESVSVPIKLTSPAGNNGDMFGATVAVNGDTIVVGAPGSGNNYLFDAVYVFTKPSSGWESTSDAAKLTPETSELRDWFGFSVAIDGDAVVVGGKTNSRYPRSHDVYVFTKPEGGWESTSMAPIKVFVDRSGYYLDRHEFPVGVAGDSVFVGTPNLRGFGVVYAYEDFLDG